MCNLTIPPDLVRELYELREVHSKDPIARQIREAIGQYIARAKEEIEMNTAADRSFDEEEKNVLREQMHTVGDACDWLDVVDDMQNFLESFSAGMLKGKVSDLVVVCFGMCVWCEGVRAVVGKVLRNALKE